ncbi:hypothetical protein MBANPS3_011634 [Mucor bainieri]
MTAITDLPQELVCNIFNKFEMLEDVAEFGHVIPIPSTEAKIRSLSAFLQVDPARKELIRHLHLGSYIWATLTSKVELLRLVLTPNIESITGRLADYTFIGLIMDILKHLPDDTLGKLKTLALSYGEKEPPLELAWYCRKSIESMTMNFLYYENGEGISWTFVDTLIEFQHLTSFTLTAVIHNAQELNRIVDGCPHLQDLTLTVANWHFDNTLEEVESSKQQALKRPHAHLKTLKIRNSEQTSSLIEYFLCKLVHLEKISVDVPACDIFYRVEEEIVRIPSLIRKVPQREILYKVELGSNQQNTLACLRGATYTCTMEYLDASRYAYIRVDI